MDEFVQVEDLNQEEEGAAVLESTVAVNNESLPITRVQEERTTTLQEDVSPVTTNIEPVLGVKVDEILASVHFERTFVKEDVHSAEAVAELKSLKMMMEITFTFHERQ